MVVPALFCGSECWNLFEQRVKELKLGFYGLLADHRRTDHILNQTAIEELQLSVNEIKQSGRPCERWEDSF
jgi:hypothetical protein